MSDPSDTKICPMCAEIIKAQARVCPHCQSRQSRLAIWGYEALIIFSGVAFLVIGIGFFVIFAPDDKGVGGRDFARYREDLRVVNSTLGRAKSGDDYRLIGTVTNVGAHPWRVHEFEVRFLGPNGELVDVAHKSVDLPFVVQPGKEQAFVIEPYSTVTTNDIAGHQARVQSATDGDRPYVPD